MATINLNIEIEPLDGFSESDFIKKISENLEAVNATRLSYGNNGNLYVFQIEYIPVIPLYPYQPILGCFSRLEEEYPHVKIISQQVRG